MRKGLTILTILALVLTLGFVELHYVKKTLTSLEDMIMDLNMQYELNEEDITIFYDEVGDLKEYWEENENWLCFLFNHRDLSVITDSINRLRAYTKNNDYDNSISELALLKEYSTESYHILGFNIHNVL